MDDIQALLDLQASVITDRPVEIPFQPEDVSMLPDGVTMEVIRISPAKVGTVYSITALLTRIDLTDLEKITVTPERKFAPEAVGVFEKYSEVILEVICWGIHNSKGEFPYYLKGFLKANCTWEDLHVLLNAILFRLGSLGFISSTTMLTKVGLTDPAETIALERNLKSYSALSPH